MPGKFTGVFHHYRRVRIDHPVEQGSGVRFYRWSRIQGWNWHQASFNLWWSGQDAHSTDVDPKIHQCRENSLNYFINTFAIAFIKPSGNPSRGGKISLEYFTNTKAIASIKPSGVALHPFQSHQTQSPETHVFLKNLLL
ncbi:hypothetical protein [Moorena producens]|uniref:hypothetical protein n=1 Tax=Moorena producens TaxID=1155739 RepID=UPI003C73750F